MYEATNSQIRAVPPEAVPSVPMVLNNDIDDWAGCIPFTFANTRGKQNICKHGDFLSKQLAVWWFWAGFNPGLVAR